MTNKKLVVIGLDGLDPKICRSMIAEGKLPNFKKLAEEGSFSELQTSNPPQSPVAWSNFISGHNPGHHDVFDFIARDPNTYKPEIGMTKATAAGFKGRRQGRTFWDELSDKGIPSVILHCPVTFPAKPLHGRLLSGMGTPDIKGTQGIFSIYTTENADGDDVQGRIERVEWKNGKIETTLTGPKKQTTDGVIDVGVPLTIERLDGTVRIHVEGEETVLAPGEWSPWITVKFNLRWFRKVQGLVRFHLNSIEPRFSLYASPVNIDPHKPLWPISFPSDYSKRLNGELGAFYTQGMPYDTWALNEGRIDEKTFLEQAYHIHSENLALLDTELKRFDRGLLFAYFGITDLIQHMFWRYRDKDHPNAARSDAPAIQNAIENVYREADRLIGEVREKIGSETPLIVLSDHGFGSFRRAAHVNTWLLENGYLALTDGQSEVKELFRNVDWSRSKAYAVGFGGLYINQFGREKYGIVYKGKEAEDLKTELIEKLTAWTDGGRTSLIEKVYTREELYDGPYAVNGPDLYIGFKEGYRASWQTALGAGPKGLIEDNMKNWSGDHLCDPRFVPGVLMTSRPLEKEITGLENFKSTLLTYFDIGLDHD